MKRILVPVDFSSTSLNALQYGIEMFREEPLQVTLANFYATPKGGAFMMKNLDSIMEREASDSMNGLLKEMEGKYPNVSFVTKVLNEDAASTISDMGDSGKYDYIVMGTKGASGLKEVFMGSVAGEVISSTTAPVIVVPASYAYRPAEEVLMTIGDEPVADNVVEPLIELLRITGDHLKIVHIVKKSDEKMEVPLGKLEPHVTQQDYIFGSGDVNEDLNDYILKDGARLVCMVRTRKGFFNRIFNESVTLKQTFHSPVPLLILHE